jgi:hypothetical protein
MQSDRPPAANAEAVCWPVPETGSAAEAQDWAATPLGPRETWPDALKTAAGIALGSNIPMMVAWGPDLLLVHNDSYGEILGDRRPAQGRPMREIWSDIWDDVVRPNCERVLGGETVYMEAAPRPLRRGGVEETAWSAATPAQRKGCARARKGSG